MAVLVYLAQHHERVVGADELLEHVWEGRVVTQSSVQKSINGLRKALNELAVADDKVTHFAKRGYQITARVSQSPPSSPRLRLSPSVFIIGLTLLFAFAVSTFWLSIEQIGQVEERPEGSQRNDTLLSYRERGTFLTDKGLEHSVAIHQATTRIAFLRDELDRDASNSKVFVRRSDGSEWLLSTARGNFKSLAWSPSGRNLAVLEIHGADGPVPHLAFGQATHFYHTFHIFTLDFKGERVIEKNVFSHWQGNVDSISWLDDSELEFVASQGGADGRARYRYNFPLQSLSRVMGLPKAYQPLISKLYQGNAAVVCRTAEGLRLVYLDRNEKIVGDHRLAQQVSDITWMPSGQGALSGEGVFLISPQNNSLGFMTVDGQFSQVKTPLEWQGDILQIEPASAAWGALAAVELYNAGLQWFKHEAVAADLIWHQSNTQLKAATFAPNENSIYFSTLENSGIGKHITTFYEYTEQGASVSTRIEGEANSFVIAQSNNTYYLLNDQVWHYDHDLQNHRLLTTAGKNLKSLVSVNEKERFYLALVMENDVLNLWRVDYDNKRQKQLTYGDLSSAIAFEQGVLFQYKGQQGLWLLDYQASKVKQWHKDFPKNIKFVNLNNHGVYFVKGGPCHETELYLLNLSNNAIQLIEKRENPRVNTYAVHPQHGILSGRCGLNNTDIVRLRH